ncbi:MAG TPA: hypothetical protein VHX62_06720 [Solirubrobacteraceae bacterium]|jgi:hypothetical protein|nr:hypothetical protein [Solirubrobacteraceae bacterium]
MYQSKDELWLLSRGGRVPPVSRAGPRYRDRLAPHDREAALAGRSRGRLPVPALRPARLRRALGGGGRADHEPARAPSIRGYASPESYVELEFAVGFGTEEETWL